jgi:hypothetical protein
MSDHLRRRGALLGSDDPAMVRMKDPITVGERAEKVVDHHNSDLVGRPVMAEITSCSVSVSNSLVASSRTKKLGAL